MIVCAPTSLSAALSSEALPGVEVVAWDGAGAAPEPAGAASFLIAPYGVSVDPRHILDQLPDVRVVQLLSAGVDAWVGHIRPGVTLCRGVGIHTSATAELAVTLAVMSVRRLPAYIRQQDEAVWRPLPSTSLAGRRVLVVGAGDIGQATAERFRAMDTDVTLVARTPRADVRGVAELPMLLPVHDVVVIVVPLTAETHGLVDAAFLAAMPNDSLLVNVARGPVVDTEALTTELNTGRLFAALDVVDPEPLPEHPLWSAPNVLITPHVGGGTTGWAALALDLVRGQITRVQQGKPLRYVVERDY